MAKAKSGQPSKSAKAPAPEVTTTPETAKPAPKVMGRPTSYRPEFVKQAQRLCALGATDIEMADFFEVNIATLYRWKNEHQDFCEALIVAKEVADKRVERSLFARANGYEHDEVDIRVVNGEIVQTPIRKFYPPDTTAGIFWLKNRQPDKWRDRTHNEVSGPDGAPVAIKVLFGG